MLTDTPRKPYIQQQAEVDAAHLIQLLVKATELGLFVKGKPDAKAAQAIIDQGERDSVRPRHDLLEPAKLLHKLSDLRRTEVPKLTDRPGVNVNVSLNKVARDSIEDLTPIYAVLESSHRQKLFDVGVSAQGIVVRLENVLFLLTPQEIYAAVADAFGMPLTRATLPAPKPFGLRFGNSTDS